MTMPKPIPTDAMPDAVAEVMPPPERAAEHQGAKHIAAIANEALATMRRRADGTEQPIPTPWREVNEALQGGLWPQMYTLTSGTGAGKSQWALQVALHAAQREQEKPEDERRPVVYVALELGALDIVARLAGLLSGKRWSDLVYGNGSDETTAEIRRAHAMRNIEAATKALLDAQIDDLPLRVEVAPPTGWSADRLLGMVKELNPRMVVIDYLQLVSAPKDNPRADLRQSIGAVAYAARAIARDNDVTVLLLSSTSRQNYEKVEGEDGTPGAGDPARLVGLGKESGEIEFAADVALALAREKWEPEKKDQKERRTWLAVAKQRGGPKAWVELNFDGSKFSGADARPSAKANASEWAR